MDNDQMLRIALIGAGVALLPIAWRGFCGLIYLVTFAAGRLTRELTTYHQARRPR